MDRAGANSYFGTLRRHLQTRHVRVGEYAYDGNSRIGRHAHEQPFLSLLLRGRYRERVGGTADEVSGPALVVHAAGESHQDEFADEGAVIVSIDLPTEWLDAASLRGRSMHRGAPVDAAARAVARSLRADEATAAASLEPALLHLVGALFPASTGRRVGTPAWVRQVAACLHDNYARQVPLAELAALAGVHPVHLARHFHQTFRCTIGDYVRALRVDRAIEALADTRLPLADIAAAHGFSDQSHLSRVVFAQTGRTPKQWRG